MDSNFPNALRRVLAHEGGYVDHPSDPGGATNLGVTIATLRAWRQKPVTKADVKALTRAEAAAIYRARYWQPAGCDDLPLGLDYCHFDATVNSGAGRSAKFLAASRTALPAAAVVLYCDRRMAFLRSLKTWLVFGKGWAARVAHVRAAALADIAGQGATSDEVKRQITAQAKVEGEKGEAARRAVARTATGTAVIAPSAPVAVRGKPDFAAAAGLVALLAAGGLLIWFFVRRRRKAEARAAVLQNAALAQLEALAAPAREAQP